MKTKLTATVLICAVAGTATAVALTRPATEPAAAAAPAAVTETASAGHDGHDGYGSDGAAEAVATPAPEGVVTIEGFAFGVSGTFAPGQTITVTNLDSAPHTLTSSDGAFDTGTIEGGGSVQLTLPSAPGTYAFFCGVHPSMTGALTIAG